MSINIFDISHKSSLSKARIGTVTVPHGKVRTPCFMPIGTVGSVKSLTKWELEELDALIILGNTYHLWLRPDMEVIERAGGLHAFTNWDRPLLTDSGGFQGFSLAKIRKFGEDGVTFNSHINGEERFLSPEISMQIQTTLGSDIALVLDECLQAEVTQKEAYRAMLRTHRWAKRSQLEFEKLRQQKNHSNVLFGIPQGAQFDNLRKQSAELTMELDFAGYSIGGVANGGEPEEIMYNQVLCQTELLEDYKPRHLLGVGTPKDIIEMVKRGIDMFDCVYPTRNARHGTLFGWIQNKDNDIWFATSKEFRKNPFSVVDNLSKACLEYENIKITNKKYETEFTPINPYSKFPELRHYTKAYLKHLFRTKELLAYRLATLNNLEFYLDLMQKISYNIWMQKL